MFKFLLAIVFVAFTSPSLFITTEHIHYDGSMGNPSEDVTKIAIHYNGTPNSWVEVYVDNYNIFGGTGYTNSSGNFTCIARASTKYPSYSSDLPHKTGPQDKYIVDAYEGNNPAVTLQCYCPCP